MVHGLHGGGGAGTPLRSARGRRQPHQMLPFDVLVDIAARTDPATLVRCAATCMDMRCRLKHNPGLHLHGRLRLRLRHGDRFVLPLLRGHLIRGCWRKKKEELFLMDTTAADATRLHTVTDTTDATELHTVTNAGSFPLASRDGLILTRVGQELRVSDPATGNSHTLPSQPVFPLVVGRQAQATREIGYDLLVGDNEDKGGTAVGRHFQVVMAYVELSQHRRLLQLQTFSSEHDAWGRYTEIRAPKLHGSRLQEGLGRALVVDNNTMYLSLMTDTRAYVLKLHVKTEVMALMLLDSFPRSRWHNQILATLSAGGNPTMLVAEGNKMLAWAQSKQTGKWQQRPHVVFETDAISRFLDKVDGGIRPLPWPSQLHLVSFAKRSGTVLIMSVNCFFWLDLQSMKIVRWFSVHDGPDMVENIPYEINLTDWVPTFNSRL
ncbi:uncharacterized protein LOC123398561 [Hordeum vulgare subsp. vulgare]|nr:uncharacterized protein LOC123398561 [Hordeum vulgare subsp. vulgare]